MVAVVEGVAAAATVVTGAAAVIVATAGTAVIAGRIFDRSR
jgi:hypothetical protein